jgi:membrane associated rhomboid family serine protease
MWSLWIFGDNVEDRFGHIGFLIFYLLCGILAGLAHIIINPSSDLPTIGASGAIAGVMGAYLTMFPRANIRVIVPIVFWPIYLEVPAIVFALFWAYTQIINGLQFLNLTSQNLELTNGGVAWWAHVGGFVAGIILTPLFLRLKKQNL